MSGALWLKSFDDIINTVRNGVYVIPGTDFLGAANESIDMDDPMISANYTRILQNTMASSKDTWEVLDPLRNTKSRAVLLTLISEHICRNPSKHLN